ncbi:MAG: hypothetical protein VKJ06_03570 [Vampirovibrionales bacterium]|nr:hypothetical protein [Vampirovibrionales bacterium]
MIKIEIVHNQSANYLIRDLCTQSDIVGYSTMAVDSACGPNWRVIDSDPTDPHYYTFILAESSNANTLLKRLKTDLAETTELMIWTSEIQLI